jgi:hypothetical protein
MFKTSSVTLEISETDALGKIRMLTERCREHVLAECDAIVPSPIAV